MPSLIQTSFMGGELSLNLYGMVDLAKYKQATALMRNFFADYRGGASSRFGTRFILPAKDPNHPVRLIPFTASFTVTYVMEFGQNYIRFYTNGGPVLETAEGISAIVASQALIQTTGVYVVGDWVYIENTTGLTGINGNYYQIIAVAGNVYTLSNLDGTFPVWVGGYTGGGTVARIYTIPSPYLGSDLAMVKFAQNVQFMVFCHNSYKPQLLTYNGPTNWTFEPIQFGSTIPRMEPQPAFNVVQTSLPAGSGWSYLYGITAVDNKGRESPPTLGTFIDKGNIDITTTTSGGGQENYSNYIYWKAVPGAVSYNVYRAGPVWTGATGPSLMFPPPLGMYVGLIASTSATSFTDGGAFSNVHPDYSLTPPVPQNPFFGAPIDYVVMDSMGSGYTTPPQVTMPTPSGQPGGVTAIASATLNVNGEVESVGLANGGGTQYLPQDDGLPVIFTGGGGSGAAGHIVLATPQGGNPAVPCYTQQRLALASRVNTPQSMDFSQPGAPYDFDTTDPVQPDNAIEIELVSKQLNTIVSMVPMPYGLIVLTQSSAFLIYGSSGPGSPISATSIVAQSQAYNGCSHVPPIVANDDILYVQSKNSIVRDLRYNFYTAVYTGVDISVLSNHLFYEHQIKEWAWGEEPFRVVWAIRDDGILLSLTFSKEQEIYGWAHSDTVGTFQSIATVTELSDVGGVNIDAIYVVVNRIIGGQPRVYIERMADRFMPYGIEDAWCLDCATQSAPAQVPNATISFSSTAVGPANVFVSAAILNGGMLGQVIRAGGGIATISIVSTGQTAVVNITQPLTEAIANVPLPAGSWSIWIPATTFSGLQQLNGMVVNALADGQPVFGLTVSNGSITLPNAASKVLVGLPYLPQLQTLPVEVGQPTVQGKRKRAGPSVVKMRETRGLSIGRTFQTLVDIKDAGPPMLVPFPQFVFGDEWVTLDALYDPYGQICIQQNNPWPVTIEAIIPDVEVGDTRE